VPLARYVNPAAALAKKALFPNVAGTDEEKVAQELAHFGSRFVRTRHATDFLFMGQGTLRPQGTWRLLYPQEVQRTGSRRI